MLFSYFLVMYEKGDNRAEMKKSLRKDFHLFGGILGGASATNCELDEHPTSSFSKVFSISSSGTFSMLSGRLPAFRINVKYPS